MRKREIKQNEGKYTWGFIDTYNCNIRVAWVLKTGFSYNNSYYHVHCPLAYQGICIPELCKMRTLPLWLLCLRASGHTAACKRQEQSRRKGLQTRWATSQNPQGASFDWSGSQNQRRQRVQAHLRFDSAQVESQRYLQGTLRFLPAEAPAGGLSGFMSLTRSC